MIPRCCGKTLRSFGKKCDVHCLKTGPFSRKNLIFEMENVRFQGEKIISSSIGLEIYILKITQHNTLKIVNQEVEKNLKK